MSQRRGELLSEHDIDDSDNEEQVMALLGDTRGQMDDLAVSQADERYKKFKQLETDAKSIYHQLIDLKETKLYTQWVEERSPASSRLLWKAVIAIAHDVMLQDLNVDPRGMDLERVIDDLTQDQLQRGTFYRKKLRSAKESKKKARDVRENNKLLRREFVRNMLSPGAAEQRDEMMRDIEDRQSRPEGRMQIRLRDAGGDFTA